MFICEYFLIYISVFLEDNLIHSINWEMVSKVQEYFQIRKRK